MTTRQIEVFPRQMRGSDPIIFRKKLRLLRQFLQLLNQDRTPRKPQRQSWTYVVVKTKQLHLPPELSVISLFCLLEHRKISLHLRLIFKSGTVNPLKLRVLFIALIVSASYMGKLKCPNISRPHHVRTSTEIQKIAVLKQGNFLAFRDVLQIPDLKLRIIP